MKKLFILIVSITTIISINVNASSFTLNKSKFSFLKSSDIENNFNIKYNIESSNNDDKEVIELAKKTTNLLLGDFNNTKESSKNYYRRHKDYLNLMYKKDIPKDSNSITGFDEKSTEYKDYLISSMSLTNVFLQLNNTKIIYNSYGDITISYSKDLTVAKVVLPNVKIEKEDNNNPYNYSYETTNLILYYYYKKLDNEYKLYYLYGNTDEDVNNYLDKIEDSELTKRFIISSYDSFSEVYDYNKINKYNSDTFNKIYETNKNNLVYLSTYYNNAIISNANGFYIKNNLIVTSWSYIEKALREGQYITYKRNDGKIAKVNEIVSIIPKSDIAVLKVEENNSFVTLSSNINNEDVVATISSKTGINYNIFKGIVISNNNKITTTVPLSIEDIGSAVFDTEGKLVGISTAFSVNTNTSILANYKVLKQIQKLNVTKTISFNDLKAKYYYVKSDDEIVSNNIDQSIWKKYKEVGNIENTIKGKLVKANYKDGILSLRYQNSISDFVSNMDLGLEFINKLEKNGYKKIIDTDIKKIYRNKDYEIIMLSEFDYLIVVVRRI